MEIRATYIHETVLCAEAQVSGTVRNQSIILFFPGKRFPLQVNLPCLSETVLEGKIIGELLVHAAQGCSGRKLKGALFLRVNQFGLKDFLEGLVPFALR